MTDSGKIDRSIIIVTRNYEPICKTSPEKAFCLLYSGRAVGYSFSDKRLNEHIALHSVDSVYHVPKVIILKSNFDMARVLHKGFVYPTKRHIFYRDNHKCGYCGKKATTLDHIKPVSKGGKNTWENLVAACARCNNIKGDKLLEETSMQLQIQPRALTPYDLINKIIDEFTDIIENDGVDLEEIMQ